MWVTVSAEDTARLERCVAIMHRMGARYEWMTTSGARLDLLNRKGRMVGDLYYYERSGAEFALIVYHYRRQGVHCLCGGLGGSMTALEALEALIPKLKEIAFEKELVEYQIWWPIPAPNPDFPELKRLAERDPRLRLELVVQGSRFTIERLTFARESAVGERVAGAAVSV